MFSIFNGKASEYRIKISYDNSFEFLYLTLHMKWLCISKRRLTSIIFFHFKSKCISNIPYQIQHAMSWNINRILPFVFVHFLIFVTWIPPHPLYLSSCYCSPSFIFHFSNTTFGSSAIPFLHCIHKSTNRFSHLTLNKI